MIVTTSCCCLGGWSWGQHCWPQPRAALLAQGTTGVQSARALSPPRCDDAQLVLRRRLHQTLQRRRRNLAAALHSVVQWNKGSC